MTYWLSTAAMALVPLAAIVWFIVSLVVCLKTPKGHEKRKAREITLFVAGLVGIMCVVLPLLFMAMMYLSVISFM